MYHTFRYNSRDYGFYNINTYFQQNTLLIIFLIYYLKSWKIVQNYAVNKIYI